MKPHSPALFEERWDEVIAKVKLEEETRSLLGSDDEQLRAEYRERGLVVDDDPTNGPTRQLARQLRRELDAAWERARTIQRRQEEIDQVTAYSIDGRDVGWENEFLAKGRVQVPDDPAVTPMLDEGVSQRLGLAEWAVDQGKKAV